MPIPFDVTGGIRAEVRLSEITDALQKLEDSMVKQLHSEPDHVVHFFAKELRAGDILRSVARDVYLKRYPPAKSGLVKISKVKGVGVKTEMAGETDSVKIPGLKGAAGG